VKSVEGFFSELIGKQSEIAELLHQILEEELGLEPKLKYNIPFYYKKSWICYLNPVKGEGIELAFTRADELSNEWEILDFKNRKQVAGISIFNPKAIPLEALYATLQEAILLDEVKKYGKKRKK